MSDLFNAPLFKLLNVLKRCIRAVHNNDDIALSKLKQQHAELFTDEFRLYIREWLGSFGFTNEMLDRFHNIPRYPEIKASDSNGPTSIHYEKYFMRIINVIS